MTATTQPDLRAFFDYRVRVQVLGQCATFDIVEVYYDEHDKIVGWTEVRPHGTTITQLLLDLADMAAAAKLGYLTVHDLTETTRITP